MSDLQTTKEDFISGVDVEECGKSLRVASNTPHLISLGCDRLSTSVTIHPLRQGRVTLGSNPNSDIILHGTGVQPEHSRIENSNAVVTLYPVSGVTTIDGVKVDVPIRLSQGCMIGIGRSNYLRFNHPAEASLMKSVLPNTRISMAPIQFLTNDSYDVTKQQDNLMPINSTYNRSSDVNQTNEIEKYERLFNSLSGVLPYKGQAALDSELDMINKDIGKKKPPVAPRRMFRDLDQISNSSSSDQEVVKGETIPKTNSIMSKVSKFEYYVKNSQRGTKNGASNEIWSPKVFSANSLTVNTPATDVLVGKNYPSTYTNKNIQPQNGTPRSIFLNDNNAVEARNCSYTNVTIKNQTGKIDQITRTFDGNRNPNAALNYSNYSNSNETNTNRTNFKMQTPSPSFNRNPVFNSPTSDANKAFFPTPNFNSTHQQNQRIDNQKMLEQARIDEILNMCAEYEKQHAMGTPTTPTEKKTHNKIITNGSLPRGMIIQNNPSNIPGNDGYYRIDNVQNIPQHISNTPNTSKSSQNATNNYGNYDSLPSSRTMESYAIAENKVNDYNKGNRQENYAQNSRQFPITELSSPVMIRKIARNAQNTSNYIASHDRNPNPNLNLNIKNANAGKNVFSPYENISIQGQGLYSPNGYIPKSPNSNSPRTRIITSFAQKKAAPPQHFIFPSPPPIDKNNHTMNNFTSPKKQFDLMDDIPMIDDTNFANELEIRISRLNPENREKAKESLDDFIIEPLENVLCGQRRNFEEIKRDLIAGIPEFDAFNDDLANNLITPPNTYSNNRDTDLQAVSNSLYGSSITEVKNNISIDKYSANHEINKNTSPVSINIERSIMHNFENHTDNITNQNICEINIQSVEHKTKNNLINKNEQFIAMEKYANEVQAREDSMNIENSRTINKIVNESNIVLPEKNSEMNQLESLYSKRKQIMNDMKETKTDINDIELSMKQSELDLDDFEIRIKTLEERIEEHKQQRKNEIELAIVSETEKSNFKDSQEERQANMKEMHRRLEQLEASTEEAENDFSKGVTTLDALRQTQELLENERKLFEDMEFQYLEKESEFYSRLSKEQNVLQNDPWGTCKKIERLEEFIRELECEYNLSKINLKESNDSENPHLKHLLDKLSTLENNLHDINEEINEKKKKIGIFRINENNDIENRKARIKSGDFSPPTSDDDDMNEIKSRIKSIDNGISDNTEKDNTIEIKNNSINGKNDDDNDDFVNILEYQHLNSTKSDDDSKLKSNIDQMSMSMIVETQSDLQDMFEERNGYSRDNSISPEKTNVSDFSETVEKKGFWERNFDSLNRLKSKDKKNKSKNQDLMSQSFNENLFYNNDNIESEYGSFDKSNSLKRPSKSKENGKSKSEDSGKSKISSLTSLGKIIRRDSLGKKNKDTSKRATNDKENVNMDYSEKIDENSKEQDQKNGKHRYLKNAKTGSTDNKYTNKSSKVMQNHNTSNDAKISKEVIDAHNHSLDSKIRSLEAKEYQTNSLNHTISICENISKTTFRKSAGDEIKKKYTDGGIKFCDNGKIPSQDDIDRISKVALDSPILTNNGDINTLGRKTLDSLRELERNRVAMLEQEGCQVIENEREKMSELKKRIQNETTLKWNENHMKAARNESQAAYDADIANNSTDSAYSEMFNRKDDAEQSINDDLFRNSLDCSSSIIIEDVGSPEKLRNSHSDSYNSSANAEDERSGSRNDRQSSPMTPQGHTSRNDIRPLSEMSDMSSDNGLSPLVEGNRRSRKASSNSLSSPFAVNRYREDTQRPLTRYLPIENDDLDLRQHIESAGHQVDLCPHISINSTSCKGYLHKLGAKFHGWSKRWFVFDRSAKTLIYYSDKNEKKPRGGAYFQVIEEVYMDHLNASKSPTPSTTFVIKTRQRRYYLMAPSGPAARMWIDVVFTGAQGYTEYLQ